MVKVITNFFNYITKSLTVAKEELTISVKNIKSGNGKFVDYIIPAYLIVGFAALAFITIPFFHR